MVWGMHWKIAYQKRKGVDVMKGIIISQEVIKRVSLCCDVGYVLITRERWERVVGMGVARGGAACKKRASGGQKQGPCH